MTLKSKWLIVLVLALLMAFPGVWALAQENPPGPDVAPPETPASQAQGASVSIVEIEVNQALGRKQEGDAFLPITDFVARKDTVIRVFLSEAVAPDKSAHVVEVYRDGNKIAALSPSPKAEPAKVLTFTPQSREEAGDWQAGAYRFVAKIGSATQARENCQFIERKSLHVLAVPVKANYNGEVKSPDDRWKNAGEFMKRVFPVPHDGMKWEVGQELDASGINITTDEGQRQIWEALNNLQVRGAGSGDKKYDLIVGFIAVQIPVASGGALQGFTFGAPSNIVVNADEDMMATVAHEVAHVYGIGDEYKGGTLRKVVNAPPNGYNGTDWDTRENVVISDSIAKNPPESYGEGSLIKAAEIRPFEVGGRGELPDMKSFMGTGGKQAHNWVTPYIWGHLFKQLDPNRTTAAARSLFAGMSIGELASAEPNASTLAPQRVIEVSGWVSKAGEVELEMPWYSFSTTEAIPQGSGDYAIQAVGKDGKVLGSQKFAPEFFVKSNPPKYIDPAPFEGVLAPFPVGTVKFQIVKGDKVLKEVPVTPNAPTVALTSQLGGKEIAGEMTITWKGADQDGGELYYDVEYSPDGQDWIFLATSITKAEWAEDFSTLPGGAQAQIRITASDGINNTEAVSPGFKVPFKAPEIFVESPEEPEITIPADAELDLYAEAYDLQDDWIDIDKQLVWTSDRDGKLGEGNLVYADQLSVGKHVITFKATNSKGLSATKSFVVNVTKAAGQPAAEKKPAPPPAESIKVLVNGQALKFDVAPIIVNGRTLVPLRAIFEALGMKVGWEEATQTVTGSKEGRKVVLRIGSNTALVNGESKNLDVPGQVVNGRTLVPVRFVAESTGAKVDWDGATSTVVITAK